MIEEAFPCQQTNLRKHFINSVIHERVKEAEESTKIDELLRTVNLNGDQIKFSAEYYVKIIYYDTKHAVANDMHKAGLRAACCDENTDISTLYQFITFVKFVDSNGDIQNKFMDIRSFGEKGGKAWNHLNQFKSIAKEKKLDLIKFCGFSCDRAAAMMCVKHGLTTLLKQDLIQLDKIYCQAHRLALSVQDAIKLAQFFIFKKNEEQLLQLHHCVAKSPLHAAQNALIAELKRKACPLGMPQLKLFHNRCTYKKCKVPPMSSVRGALSVMPCQA
ncbi:MAG: hypothetical protein EZS28_013161 [Streblomastix strix]|uniref:DUF4371 domain-containing protein n=1 Tax=Streblomastix strix TaxID=222440 RepID=A0A5J4W8S6_9EUKA|nr:MAG: hypothetical protein EZS28_013161 [Streblomastix strix]